MAEIVDKLDFKLLYLLDQNCRVPETRLAKALGRSKESVRYRIKQLQDKGIITRFTLWLDPTKLGFHTYKMYLKLANIPEQRKAFVKYITAEPRLFWLGTADGAWDAGLTFFARTNNEFYELEHEITSRFENLITNKQTGVLVSVHMHSKDLFVDKGERKTLTIFSEPAAGNIDELEEHLIKILFHNSRTSLVELAKKTGSTVDIVRTRLRRLEERKVIAGYRAAIDFVKLGYEFYKTFLYFRKLSAADERALTQYSQDHPNIIHFVRQISPWDVELEILVENHTQYNTIINDLRQRFAAIIKDVESAVMHEDYVFPAETLVFEQQSI